MVGAVRCGAVLVSMPVVSMLSITWLYMDTGDVISMVTPCLAYGMTLWILMTVAAGERRENKMHRSLFIVQQPVGCQCEKHKIGGAAAEHVFGLLP